jgi:hypothetical protein
VNERAIARIEVMSGSLGVSRFHEPAAANGVIVVTRR